MSDGWMSLRYYILYRILLYNNTPFIRYKNKFNKISILLFFWMFSSRLMDSVLFHDFLFSRKKNRLNPPNANFFMYNKNCLTIHLKFKLWTKKDFFLFSKKMKCLPFDVDKKNSLTCIFQSKHIQLKNCNFMNWFPRLKWKVEEHRIKQLSAVHTQR